MYPHTILTKCLAFISGKRVHLPSPLVDVYLPWTLSCSYITFLKWQFLPRPLNSPGNLGFNIYLFVCFIDGFIIDLLIKVDEPWCLPSRYTLMNELLILGQQCASMLITKFVFFRNKLRYLKLYFFCQNYNNTIRWDSVW